MTKKRKEDLKKESTKDSFANSNSLFTKTLEMFSKDVGEGVIQSLSQLKETEQIGLSSGSLLLDWIINPKVGGMCIGKVLEVWGPYSTGKTTAVLGFCANATANGKRVVYADLERSLQPEVVLNAGVNEDLFTVIKMKDGRELTRVLGGLMKTGEVGVVVIDSLPHFKPIIEPKKGEDDADPTKPKMAFGASFQTEALDYLTALADDHGIVLILINQVRNRLDGYGGGKKPYGGDAKDHMVSVRLRFSGRATSSTSQITDDEGNIIGQYVSITSDKNKTSVPMKVAEVPLFLGRGIDPYMELALVAQKVGIVDGTAGRFKWTDTGESIAHGKNNFAKKLYEDNDLYQMLREKCIQSLGLHYEKSLKIVNAFHDDQGNKRTHIATDITTDIEKSVSSEDDAN